LAIVSETLRYMQSEAAEAAPEYSTLVKYILMDAVKAKASDIHIEPWESTLVVRIRLNGVLTELIHLPLEYLEKISGRFKVLANLVTYQAGLPQEGHVPADPELGGVEQRISIFPTVRGEKIVVRIFDPSNRSFDLASLGFDDDVLQQFVKLIIKPSGLILLTGPTGSGKTTAIYSALYTLVQRAGSTMSIATVEDPVEFNLPMVAQAQVNLAQEFTYPRALRSLMRQDPQVIMVGEIRDPETAAIAVQAGLTGHLVISTIHSGSTAGVFARLMNMQIEPFLLASSVTGVLGVRLIRKNCTFCSMPYEPDPAYLKLVPLVERDTAEFRRGAGCEQCLNTGFSGRYSVSEMLVVNQPFREAVVDKVPTRALQQVAIDHGMITMWRRGLNRVLTGNTTLEEILRVISVDEI
jgi:type II secretory ATPase GspE/PulE/Tfp pilus assembly ATPase PilB-like protein